jgi:hypothetical protein
MSTSSDGSVNGKKDGRKRIFTFGDLEERLAELLENPFQVAEMARLVDDQPSTWWNIGVCVWSLNRSGRCGRE